MATEIADAYIALRVKMPGVKNDITKGLGGGDVDAEFGKAGSKFGGTLTKAIGGIAIAGIAAVGAVAAAGLGAALVKGFQRLDAIDQATAKLRGLGHDTVAVDQIMQNALASVRGTAFGLGDAAGVAAQLVAANVQPGQQLETTLKAIANSAAAAGTDLNDMGSIFAKVASTGKAQNDVLQQVAERGIPIYQALADQLGVTAEEVFKMASAGEIGFAEFEAAATAAAGNVAAEMGNTFQGSLANLSASLGRIGAGLLGGVFAELAPTLQAITGAMGPLEVVAGEVGEKIGQFLAPAFELLRNLLEGGFDFSAFGELLTFLSPLGLAFKIIQPLLPSLLDAFSELASSILPVLRDVFAAIVPIIQEIVPIFTGILAAVIPLVSEILPLLASLIEAIAPLFTTLLGAILPIIEPILALIAPLVELVTTILGPLIELLVPLIDLIAQGLTAALDALIPVIAGVVKFIADLLLPIIQGAKENFGLLIDFITNVFQGNWEGAWDAIAGIFENSWNAILDVGKTVLNGIIDIINGIIRTINGVVSSVGDVFGVDIGIPMIPHLADGATVMPRAGGTLAVLAEAGRAEAVVDEGLLNRALEQGIQGSESGAQNNFYMPPADPHVLAKLIARELRG